MRGVVAAISLGALALSLTACGERPEPRGTSVRLYPVTVAGASGEATVLPAAPRRILAVGRAMVPTLRALGAGRRAARAEGIPSNVGRYDLVVAWSSAEGAATLARRASDGTPVYVAPDRTIPDVERSLTDLGTLVGRPLMARTLVADLRRSVRRTAQRVADERLVTVFLDRGFFTTVSSDSLQDNMIEAAGGRNVAGVGPEGGPFDPRRLRRLNPRYYLATSDSGTTLELLRSDPATRRLGAVRAGRFGIVPAELLEPGPRIGAGVVRIARLLHPDAFR